MSLEQNNEQHYRIPVDKYNDPSGGYYYMTTRDYVLRPSANRLSGALMIILPPVAEAMGRFYSIVARDASEEYPIIITDKNDSECWLGLILLKAKCHKMLFYSDGLCWHPLGTGGVGDFPGVATTVAPETEAPTTLARSTEAPTSLEPTSLAPTS